MKKSIVILVLVILSIKIYSQSQLYIDSLNVELENSSTASKKFDVLIELYTYYLKFDARQALTYSKEAVNVAHEMDNIEKKIHSYEAVGICYNELGIYESSLDNILKALQLAQNGDFKLEELKLLKNLGVIYYHINQHDKALDYYYKSLNIYNNISDSNETVGKEVNIETLYNNIGVIYATRAEFESSKEYYLKAIELSKINSNYNILSAALNNLGKIHMIEKEYDLALKYLNEALQLNEKNDFVNNQGISYYYLSAYYRNIEDYKSAIDYAYKSYSLGMSTNTLLTKVTGAKFLYELYEIAGDIDSAFYYHKFYKIFNDSLLNKETYNNISKFQLQYEIETLEEKQIAKTQKLRLKYLLIVISLGLGIIILLLLFFLKKNRNKRIQLELDSLQKEFELRNKELTTNVMYLVRKDEFLNSVSRRLLKLKSRVIEENKDVIQKIIFDVENSIDKEVWQEFEFRFQQVHNDFYENLQKIHPDLSTTDRKIAAFLRLDMTTKEIASITGQSIGSIDAARYRLRKKMGIANTDKSLTSYLLGT